jgi:hypothetical protein
VENTFKITINVPAAGGRNDFDTGDVLNLLNLMRANPLQGPLEGVGPEMATSHLSPKNLR